MFFDTDFLQDGEIKLVLDHTCDANPEKNWLPAYYFNICDMQGSAMGACDLRIGYNDNLYYGGHIGYRVEEPYRGNRYAAKACELLFGLARKHGMEYIYITCRPENAPSYKTIERVGGKLLEITELPPDNDMREDGITHVRVYRIDL